MKILTIKSKIIRSLVYILLVFLVSSCSFNTKVIRNQNASNGDYIVLLHGITGSSWHMDSLAKYLAKNDYEVINIAYPSTSYNLENLKEIIIKEINTHVKEDKPIHFVGYSMGGLLLRTVLKDYQPIKMGKVVHIATPNQGSELADRVKNWKTFKLIYGPAGQQLITDQSKFYKIFGPVDYELGIISGIHSFNPLTKGIFAGDNDGRVSVARSILKGSKDHIKINGMHAFMPYKNEVKRQTLHFIKHGIFLKNDKTI